MENNITNKELFYKYAESLGIKINDAQRLMVLALASREEALPQADVIKSEKSAVEWLVSQLYRYSFNQPIDLGVWQELRDLAEKAKEMEKQQSLELIELSSQLTGVATVDDDISKMTYTDVYNQYYGIK